MGENSGKIQDADQIKNELSLRADEANGEENYEETLPGHEDEKKEKNALVELKWRFEDAIQGNKALIEFRSRIEDAIQGNSLLGKPDGSQVCQNETLNTIGEPEEIRLWGVPLMPSKSHAGTDMVLLKFLKSENYNVHNAFEKLKKTLIWRREFKADGILEENLGPYFEKVGYHRTVDRKGRPLFYNVYGDLKDNQNKILGSEENCEKFLRWRVQYIEKCIKELNFEPGGADSVVQVMDWKEFHGLHTRELRSAYRKWWTMLEEYYPDIIHGTIIVNVPLWYHVSHSVSSRLTTHKANYKTIFARPGRVTGTLLKFVSPENLPVEYGGLKRTNDDEFSPDNEATEVDLKENATAEIEIPANQVNNT
ncbi:Sec14p-like phosphatidylinositol transfer family protein, putative isoform 2 [Hibiscus syriacus]|uniref:Sec14p-like phosphatidylinositol transfer family protein, putative isoform 2 n=1 Tax=Hibiscus syriacus TaxID=106335 RepID=A0A6A2Z2B7_HIBSY|nr:Sec14p-like phosphatidylinositol transfer family protein, putative isoform 2 [Hibiscus syriacus]